MTSIRSLQIRHRAYFRTSSGWHSTPQFLATRLPREIQDIPEEAVKLFIEDVIELQVEARNQPDGPIYTTPVNVTCYEVFFGSKGAFKQFVGGRSYTDIPPMHPFLEGKVWLIEGMDDEPARP